MIKEGKVEFTNGDHTKVYINKVVAEITGVLNRRFDVGVKMGNISGLIK
ncbi:hypothetical protein QGM71_12495 [Virgibacillus sp. C22-A2]|uniref:Uncharacterized protein n=1 Tax=Virgibacillus tibetensis TaxID=3042313 RepID=A0ABU6KG75_9BACI|nr:hypothetical protein [Virgibacillus sp. C22-A2]